MAFDEGLAQRLRERLAALPDVDERRMFGGLAFLVRGNMAVGVHREELIARVGPEAAETALSRPGARVFDVTGRPMTGWVLVGGPALEDDDALSSWVEESVDFALSLPAK